MASKRITVTEACLRVQEVIEGLENVYREYEGQVAGTQICRVLLDRKLYIKEGIPIGHRGPVWCLSMGSLNMPKAAFYGTNIVDCLCKAQEGRRGKIPA